MTRTDFRKAADRYCERLKESGKRPPRLSLGTVLRVLHRGLADFLNELELEMANRPKLFEHPHWCCLSPRQVQEAVESAAETVAKSLAPDVVRIRYSLGEDWDGEPAIFFRVLLSDESANKRLMEMVRLVQNGVKELLDFEAVGRIAYYRYHSFTEQAQLWDKDWE